MLVTEKTPVSQAGGWVTEGNFIHLIHGAGGHFFAFFQYPLPRGDLPFDSAYVSACCHLLWFSCDSRFKDFGKTSILRPISEEENHNPREYFDSPSAVLVLSANTYVYGCLIFCKTFLQRFYCFTPPCLFLFVCLFSFPEIRPVLLIMLHLIHQYTEI